MATANSWCGSPWPLRARVRTYAAGSRKAVTSVEKYTKMTGELMVFAV